MHIINVYIVTNKIFPRTIIDAKTRYRQFRRLLDKQMAVCINYILYLNLMTVVKFI